jgi:hypothetical protein
LAGRIAVSNLQKQTTKVFSEAIEQLYQNLDPITKEPKPLIAQDVYEIILKNKEVNIHLLTTKFTLKHYTI